MSYIPTVDQARELLKKYNKDAFHLKHGEIVSGVMGYFAAEYDPERVDFWRTVGMLHDIDFELYPERHCVACQEMMAEEGIDPSVIRSCASHGYGIEGITSDIVPEHFMEKILFATDELTGLIGAVTLMRPSKSVVDLELKSVKKKYKTPAFAAGCSREVIGKGAEMLGWTLDELIERTIQAMKSLLGTMEI